MRVLIASDHAGVQLKEHLKKQLTDIEFKDLGPATTDRVDYPDFADKVAKDINANGGMGILICGSGQGMAMRANKYPNVRAALAWDKTTARLAREHNDANVLCLGERLLPFGLATAIVEEFFQTQFAGGRHERRVEKLSKEI